MTAQIEAHSRNAFPGLVETSLTYDMIREFLKDVARSGAEAQPVLGVMLTSPNSHFTYKYKDVVYGLKMEQFDIRNTMFDGKEMEQIHSAMRGATIKGYRLPMLTLDKFNWCIDPTYLGVKTKKVPSNKNIICLRECENVLSNLLKTYLSLTSAFCAIEHNEDSFGYVLQAESCSGQFIINQFNSPKRSFDQKTRNLLEGALIATVLSSPDRKNMAGAMRFRKAKESKNAICVAAILMGKCCSLCFSKKLEESKFL